MPSVVESLHFVIVFINNNIAKTVLGVGKQHHCSVVAVLEHLAVQDFQQERQLHHHVIMIWHGCRFVVVLLFALLTVGWMY